MANRAAAVVKIVSVAGSARSAAQQVAMLAKAERTPGERLSALLVGQTGGLWRLVAGLDDLGIAYQAHGAALWIAHPVACQLLLALGALADRDDGVGEAALLRPPWFGIDAEDLVAALAHKDPTIDVRRRRVSEARDLVTMLRRQRHRLTPAAMARRLISQTTLGRALEHMPNGVQHKTVLAALCAWLEALAWRDDLDCDALAVRCRSFVADPLRLAVGMPMAVGVLQILPMSLASAAECERAILWAGSLDARRLDEWLVGVDARGALTVRFASEPGCMTVREQLVVPTLDDGDLVCSLLSARWPAVAADRFEVAALS